MSIHGLINLGGNTLRENLHEPCACGIQIGALRSVNTFEEDCEVKKVPLDEHLLDKIVTINAALEPEEEKELLEFLCKNQDVFAWSANDLRRVSRDIIEHRLDINPNIKSKK